ncbi:MAG: GGDEF domain-containing protein [Sphingomonas sp.]
MANDTPDTLLRTRLDAVYPLAGPMSAMDLLGCSLIAWLYWMPATAVALAIWLAGCTVIVGARIVVATAYRSEQWRDVSAMKWAQLITAFAAASGLMWCGALAWMLAVGSSTQSMFTICVALSGLTLSIVNIAYWPIYAAFAAPVTLGCAVGFGMSHRDGGLVLAFGAAMMTIALLVTSKRLSRAVLRAHRLAETNQALIDSLAERSRELEDACRTLEQVSRTDPLTGLANRRSRDMRLAAEWERAVRIGSTLAVVAIDVDHFKRYNDTHGHAAGDRCLVAVANLLQGTARGAIDMACRHGGEEFMLILPDVDVHAAASAAEGIRTRIAVGTGDPALGLPERVTVSLGVSVAVPGEGGGLQDLIIAADAALYAAKQGGRNRYEVAAPWSDRGAAAA